MKFGFYVGLLKAHLGIFMYLLIVDYLFKVTWDNYPNT